MNYKSIGLLRSIALIVMLVGAIASLSLMFYTGRHNRSIILMALFTGWVLSPFVALWAASRMTKRWSPLTHVVIYVLMLVVTFGSLITYSISFISPIAKPAAVYLVVPFISWLLMAILIPLVEAQARKAMSKSDGA